jgi:membrane-associated protein
MGDWTQTFTEEYVAYGYPVLFLGVLLENAAIPVHGETAVMVAGFLSSPAGGSRFNLGLVIVITIVAAVLGDNLGFEFGQRLARPRLQQGRGFWLLTPATLKTVENYLERYGIWAIFFARFITGIRVVASLAAGAAGMHWWRFFIANVCGAIVWAMTTALLGYFFGQSWQLLHVWLGRGALVLLGGVVLLVGLVYLWRKRFLLPAGVYERLGQGRLGMQELLVLLHVIFAALLVLLASSGEPVALDEWVEPWLPTADSNMSRVLVFLAETVVGSLPAIVAWAVLFLVAQRRTARSWREQVAVVWAVVASELLGLLVVGLLHLRHHDAIPAAAWPFGFAGLIPLRTFAVFGMMAYLSRGWGRALGRIATAVAIVLVLLGGFGVLAGREQFPSEVLLEYAAGGLVLLGGAWWLQGAGAGLLTVEIGKGK